MSNTASIPAASSARPLAKARTGIQGLDEITLGGLPAGRPTLICGGAGCGKTLLATSFLVNGAMMFGEPGVFMSFEETSDDLIENVRSLGFDLACAGRAQENRHRLRAGRAQRDRGNRRIRPRGPLHSTGRCGPERLGARRVVLDTIEALFARVADTQILRAEIRRLFGWLKEKGLTTVITAERASGTADPAWHRGVRLGLRDPAGPSRRERRISTRRLRIVKYRGSTHGTNEYPFLIDEHGISVLPISSLGLDHAASAERISTGIARLGRHAGRQGLLSGEQHSDVRHRGNR